MAQSSGAVDEAPASVRKAVLFIEGITVSGGEADDPAAVCGGAVYCYQKRSAPRYLTCLVDSNGMLSETGWEKLLPVCDGNA